MKVGRKPIPDEEKKISISITMSQKAIEKLTKLAEKNNTSRGEEVEKLLGDIDV